MDILWRKRHLIVTFLEVQLGEHCRAVDSRGKIGNVGERITVRYSNDIQLLIITARSPIALFLLNHVKRRSPM